MGRTAGYGPPGTRGAPSSILGSAMKTVPRRWVLRPETTRWAVDGAILLAAILLAAAIRLPNLETIPRFTDEVREVWPAVGIALRGERPLVHNDAYRGAHWAYFLAVWLRLTGPRPASPRLFALLLGSLTVGVTYVLGRTVAGRRAGILAALLSATAFGHVVLISHVAWANHSTPLWTTSAVACLYRDGRRCGGWLVAAAMAWGLAASSHPSALLPFAGATLWWLTGPQGHRLLRQPGTWWAVAVLALVISPLVAYNVLHGMPALAEATRPAQPVERHLTAVLYVENLISLGGQLGRLAGAGASAEVGDPVPSVLVHVADRLRAGLTVLYGLLLLGALAAVARHAGWKSPAPDAVGARSGSSGIAHRDVRLLALAGGTGVLVMPAILDSYHNFYDMRYLGFVLPLAQVALSASVVGLAARRPVLGQLATAGICGLALVSLGTIGAHYAREKSAGRTNEPIIAAAERLTEAVHQTNGYVLVDTAMRPIRLGGGGDPTGAFRLLLALRGTPFELADVTEMRWFLEADPQATFCLVAASATRDELASQFPLTEMQIGEGWSAVCRFPPRRGAGAPTTSGNLTKR